MLACICSYSACPPEGLLPAAKVVVVGQQRLHAGVVVLGCRRHDGHRRDLLPTKYLMVQVLTRLQGQHPSHQHVPAAAHAWVT